MLVKDLVCSYDFENSEVCPIEIMVNDKYLEFDINEDGELWVQSDCLKLLDKEVEFWSAEMDFETHNEFGSLKVYHSLKLVIRAV